MLTCKEITELCTEYLERRMPPMQRLSFRFHLMLCRNCRVYLDQMQVTVDALGYVPESELPKEMEEELLHHFRDWKKAN